MKSLSLITFILISSFSHAEASCLDPKDVSSIAKEFSIGSWNGNGTVSVNTKDLCDSSASAYKVIEALIDIKRSEQDSPPNSRAADIVSAEGVFSFFKKRIKTIIIEDTAIEKLCADGNTVAYVNSRKYKNTTFICPRNFNRMDLYERGLTMIHEARHIDGHPHVECIQGVMKNSKVLACDNDYPSQGSYGVEASYSVSLAKNSRDPLLRQRARAHAVTYFFNRFNQLPLDLKNGVMTYDFDNQISFFDGRNEFPVAQLPSPAIMMKFGEHVHFYSYDGTVKAYQHASVLGDPMDGFSQDFRHSPEGFRSSLLTFRLTSKYFCMLGFATLRCIHGGVNHDVPLTSIQPRALIPNSPGSNELSILDEAGDVYQIKPPALGQSWNESHLVKVTPAIKFLDYAQWIESKVIPCGNFYQCLVKKPSVQNTQITYGLNSSFKLLKETSKGWQEEQGTSSRRYKGIAPLLWSKKIEAL